MHTGILLSAALAVLLSFALPAQAAQTAIGERLSLPSPDKQGGRPLMSALAERKTNRAISDAPLPMQEISNLLWATWGVNRPDGRRTAPTARNNQKVEVYAVMADGVWRYDGPSHSLEKVLDRDARSAFGGAPVTLVYAAEADEYGAMHVGSLFQNAGLYCASAGLANVVKATGIDVLQKELKLPAGYKIQIVQSIGLPK